MSYKKNMIILFVSLLLFLPVISLAQTTELTAAQVRAEINTALEEYVKEGEVQDLKQELNLLQDSSYLNLLEKTNDSLTQRFTPLNTMLAALAVFFTLVTGAFAVAVTWAVFYFRKLANERKEEIENLLNLQKNFEKEFGSRLKGIKEAEKKLKDLQTQKKSTKVLAEEYRKELELLKKDYSDLRNRFYHEVPLVTTGTHFVSGSNATLAAGSAFDMNNIPFVGTTSIGGSGDGTISGTYNMDLFGEIEELRKRLRDLEESKEPKKPKKKK